MYYGISGTQYSLGSSPIKSGGEGSIYAVLGNQNQLAKIYHANILDAELESKLCTMYKNPPAREVLTQIAWPVDVLYNSNRKFCGFLMNKLNTTHELGEIYKYPPNELAGITLAHKLIIAQNICTVISAVHRAGYVFGDFNPMNIGVNINDGTVAFFDADTYHFRDTASGHTHRCRACCPGYVAPELIANCKRFSVAHPEIKDVYANAPLPTFSLETDNFALSIHIFKLIMNGYTPYNGIPDNAPVSQASPGVGDRAVERNNYCFAPGNKPMATAMPEYSSLPQYIQAMLTRAFIDGYTTPAARPSADEWGAVLARFERDLRQCSLNTNHFHYKGLSTCPYCAADQRYKKEMSGFLSATAGQKKFTSVPAIGQPVVPPQTTLKPQSTGYSSSNTTHATTQSGAAYSNSSTKSKSKGLTALICAIIAVVVISCISSTPNVERDTIEILNDDLTVAVGETVEIQIRSSTYRLTARSNNYVETSWNENKSEISGGKFYLDVTGAEVGVCDLKVLKKGSEEIYDTVRINVTSSDTSAESKSEADGEGFAQHQPKKKETLNVPAATEKLLAIDGIFVGEELTIAEEPVVIHTGTLSDDGAEIAYTYTAPRDGRYGLEISDISANDGVRLMVFDSSGSNVLDTYAESDYVNLTGGATYEICVRQDDGYPQFTLRVHAQKQTTDLSHATVIHDQIAFADQKNVYCFTAPVAGRYHFEMSEYMSGTDFRMMMWDKFDNCILDTYAEEGTVSLEAGETYEFQIRQDSGYSSYKLQIGFQKENFDLTGFTNITDSIEFTDQKNVYNFTAPVTGRYRFEVSEYISGTNFRMMMWDKFDDCILDTQTEEGTVSLEAGGTYEFQIRQDSGYSDYRLRIGMQKETVDISGYDIISDSVTYTDQKNVYTFTPLQSGRYRFFLTDFDSGCSFRLMAWDNYDNSIMNTSSEDGTVSLEAGITYEVQVRQESGIGTYKLNIEKE